MLLQQHTRNGFKFLDDADRVLDAGFPFRGIARGAAGAKVINEYMTKKTAPQCIKQLIMALGCKLSFLLLSRANSLPVENIARQNPPKCAPENEFLHAKRLLSL